MVTVDGTEVLIEEKRKADFNQKMNPVRQVTLLWRPDLQHLLEINLLPQYKQKSKKFVQQKLIEKLEWEKLKPQMCGELFERDYSLWNEE